MLAAPVVFLGAPPGVAGQAEAPFLRDGALVLDGDTVVAVGPRREVEAAWGPADPLGAVVLPALVNAHTHLELSHLAGKVAGGDGLPAWIGRFVRARAEVPEEPAAVLAAVASLAASGVAAVGDVSNTLASLPALGRAGLCGRVFHEIFGLSPDRVRDARRAAADVLDAAPAPGPGLAVVPSPHAVYSTAPAVVEELLASGPASIHLAEDPAERAFVTTGDGPFAAAMAPLGAAEVRPHGRSPVGCALGLHAGNLAVHVVDLDTEDVEWLRVTGATAVLCPRSNLHISGRLPDLPRLLEAGVRLAVGTDSLASSPSLSPLADLAALSRAYPAVPAGRLLPLAWNGACVGAPAVGRLEPGSAPGVIALPLPEQGPGPDLDLDPAAWLLRASASGARSSSFRWLARHRPEAIP